jgi:hypothetical protein
MMQMQQRGWKNKKKGGNPRVTPIDRNSMIPDQLWELSQLVDSVPFLASDEIRSCRAQEVI